MKKGFTLIEVIIALSLISVVLASLYSVFFVSNRAMEAADDALLGLRELRTVFDLIGREVESAVFDRRNSSTQFKILDKDIYGKPASELTMTAFSPQKQGLCLITYKVMEEGEKLSLIKEISSLSGGEPLEAEMIEDIAGFKAEAKSKGQWVGTWDTAETSALPEEVKITITIKIKGRDTSLEQTLSPKIGRKI